ncbi:MAG: sigma-70 family RNA polymerase sigma factor [Bdellovibrionales bacterium]|nr:sigma-70 family RNA polymerase sigma factor [Bdellovibrionales bacterium]
MKKAKSTVRKDKQVETPKNDSALSLREQEKLVLEFRIKARKLGRSILRKWHARLDLQEVDSVVDLSLCEAVKRFDPKKGASFMTFLYYHLKGNLIRAVSAAAQANFIPGLDTEREAQEDTPAITALEVVEAVSGTDQRQPDELLLQKELVHLSKDACTRLDPLEKQVIERLYLQGEQLMQIANSLGYSRCHISRVKKKALEHLQNDLERLLKASGDKESIAIATKMRAAVQKPRKVQRRKRGSSSDSTLQQAA